MNRNIKKMFLLTTLIFLLVGLNTITASDINENQTNTHFKENTKNEINQLSTNTQNQPTNKSEKKNQINKKHETKTKKINEPKTTTLTIKFINDPEDEYSSEQYKTIHLNDEYTIDITLTEDEEETPITATIQLYLLEDTQPVDITLDHAGHAQQTYTSKNIGETIIYAEYMGNENYDQTTSNPLILNTELYSPTLTINTIENTCYNSTITINGTLYNDDQPMTQENILISFNNNQITTVQTDNNGKYTYDFNMENIPIQEYAEIIVEFHSNYEEIANAYEHAYISIEKIKNTIQINNIQNNTVNNNISINGKIIDENNKNYNGILNATITNRDTQEESYNNSNIIITDGKYTFNFTPILAGNYNLTITIPETEYHMENTRAINFTINKITPTLQLEEFYISTVLENVSIHGKLVDEYNQPINNTLITISSPTKTLGNIKTDDGGLFHFTGYTFPEKTSDYDPLYFDIEATENINPLHEESRHYLLLRNASITLTTDSSIKINETLHVTGSVNDAQNKTIKVPGTVTLYINDEMIKEDIEINDGKYEYSFNILDRYVGYESLNIKTFFIPYNPGIYTSEKYANATITHKKLDITITIEEVKTRVGESTIIISLHDENNVTLEKTLHITITDQFNRIVHTQDIQSTYESILTFNPVSEGTYNINAEFADEDNIYMGAIGQKSVNVTKTHTNLVIDDVPDKIHVNDTTVITGKLTDEYDNPLINQSIKIIINTTGIYNESSISTNSLGEYEYAFKALTSQQYNITAYFEENELYREIYANKIINPVKYDTRVIIDPLTSPIKYNTTILINGQVINMESGEPVNGSVIISLNDKVIDTLELDNGKYQTKHTIKTVQNNTIQVRFIDNNVYSQSDENIILETTPLKTVIQLNPIPDTTVYNTVTISGLVADENNNHPNGTLQVKYNNHVLFEDVHVDEGLFSFDVKTTRVGLNSLNLTFTPRQSYNTNATYNTTLNVIRRNLQLTDLSKQVNNKNKTITISGKLKINNNTHDRLNISIKLNDKSYSTVSQPGGLFTLNTDTLLPGNYTITISVNQTQYTNSFEEDLGILTVEKSTPVITLENINATFSKKADITGNLKDNYNKPLKKQDITIKINNIEYNTTTDNNGIYKITTDKFITGKNNITITVPETTNTHSSKYSTTFQADKAETNIIILPQEKTIPGETLIITGQLTDNENNTLSKKQVNITVDDRQYNTTTDNKGIFTLHITNTTAHTYKVNISYEDKDHKAYTTVTQFNIEKLDVKLTIDNITARVGEFITFHARITDQEGNPVNGGNIVFKLNGRTLRTDGRFDTNTTEVLKFSVKNGIVKYTMTADLYLRKGKNISASYSGSYRYKNTKSNTARANIQLRYVNISVTTSNRKLKHHQNVTFTAKLRDITPKSEKNLLNENASVIFKINGVSIKNKENQVIRTAVKNNTVKYTYTISPMAGIGKNNQLRNYTLTAIYDNQYYYPLNNKANATFNVERSKVHINIRQIKVTNSRLAITARLTDYLGYKVSGNSRICLKINGVTYKKNGKTMYYTIKNGQIKINGIDVGGMKVKRLEIVTGQRLAYLPARQSTTNITII